MRKEPFFKMSLNIEIYMRISVWSVFLRGHVKVGFYINMIRKDWNSWKYFEFEPVERRRKQKELSNKLLNKEI